MTIWHGFLLLVNVALLVCYLISCSKGYLKKRKNRRDQFCVRLPNMIIFLLLLLVALLSLRVILGIFTEDVHGNRDPIGFCIGIAVFGLLCLLYCIKVLRWCVVVKKTEIAIHYMLRPSRSFSISDIVSATREVKDNYVASERIVIRTGGHIRLVVERAMYSYDRFSRMILQNVPESRRKGW